MGDPLEQLLAKHSPTVRATFLAARELVQASLPDVVEQLDIPDHLLAFAMRHEAEIQMSYFLVALVPHTSHVNVQLANGAELTDPAGIVEGTGKRIRHVKCRTVEDVRRPALRALIEAQGAGA